MSEETTDNTTGAPQGFNPDTAEADWSDPRWRVKSKDTGLTFTLDNGWKFSVIWGWGHYCSVRDEYPDFRSPLIASPDAEVMPIPPGAPTIEIDNDIVAGWVPAADLYAALVAAHDDDVDGVRRALTKPFTNESENPDA